jgi:arylsulfatase A-like enzyme
MPPARETRIGRLIGIAVASALVAGCERGPGRWEAHPATGPSDASIRHVILISIDTLRADHLGCYGHPFVQTPNIDGLAADGILFEQHISAAPTTLNSHTSLMTGTWPHTHGAARNGFVVNEENVMLAEVLQSSGFTTAAFIGAYPLHSRFDFGQGFDHYDEAFDIMKDVAPVDQNQRSAESVTNAVLAWLDSDRPERFFLFVHYFDVHAPYSPPAPFDRMYRSDDPAIHGNFREIRAIQQALKANPKGMPAENAAMDALYCGEVSFIDEQIGRLLEGFGKWGMLEDSLIVLTGDHGEAMNEHWEIWDHGHSTYETTVRTPLIIRQPGSRQAGTRWRHPVSNIDVMPTILDRLGLESPSRVQGTSFAAVLDGIEPAPREPVFSEATKPWGSPWEDDATWVNTRKCRSVREGRWKLIFQPAGGYTELYDLEADPQEKNNLALSRDPEVRKVVRRLQAALAAWTKSAKPLPSQFDDTPQNIEALKALGYTAEPSDGEVAEK